ncbi:FIG022606: AAA ATPase [hydrothermal vent metagenome]|uniref:FIG022606: AAA ATPase n=1 Tax=hydrothermal vent metagenome TaxID=652676 RepID=A0A3B0Y8P3_9ZZZZ
MNYFEFFGLKEHPFQVSPDSRFLYLSAAHARAKAYMDYSVWKRDGFVVITGEVGAGKTTLIHKLLSEIDESATVMRVFHTQLNEIEFLQTMLSELGFSPEECNSTSKVEILNKLKNYLLEAAEQGRHVVLLVDEGQNLSRVVLEEIRMLSTPDPGGDQVLNIILVGQPELRDTLDRPDMEQLAQRIRLRFHVGTLSEVETSEYIVHRLRVAGLEDVELFDQEALKEVYRYSGGVPRRINILCDTALICAFADDCSPIGRTIIDEAIEELQWSPFQKTVSHTGGKSADKLRPWLSEKPAAAHDPSGASLPAHMQAPEFQGGEQEWSRLFSMVLNIMSDMSTRMARMESTLDSLEQKAAAPGSDQDAVDKKVLSVVAPQATEEIRPKLVKPDDQTDDESVNQ